ncbi:MAG: hypothetical protein QM699_07550 [Amaricoccus sp.]
MAALRTAIGISGLIGLAWLVGNIFVAADRAAELRRCAHQVDVCIATLGP